MLYEVGFEFQNLIPKWSESLASCVSDVLMRSVAIEFQSRLAMELIEWATVTDRLPYTDLPGRTNSENEASHGNEEDVLMNQEAGLRGRRLILKLRVTGLRVTHSSDGSISEEPPQSKRMQHGPPRPQVPSTLSTMSTPSLTSLAVYESRSESTCLESPVPMSEDRSSDSQTPATSARIQSVIGTSRASEDPSSGPQTSRGSSSEESMMSLSRGASSHMPLSNGIKSSQFVKGYRY
ncbi:hypothetical protein V7S43_007412 [Phytophthora oleae]|uniref:Uncharacterized protein n=1 Tax=Phytophthora oleae TaxID=2107226 RepID=A0ABD3FLS7_9STRA